MKTYWLSVVETTRGRRRNGSSASETLDGGPRAGNPKAGIAPVVRGTNLIPS
jgi:hypothetical protein